MPDLAIRLLERNATSSVQAYALWVSALLRADLLTVYDVPAGPERCPLAGMHYRQACNTWDVQDRDGPCPDAHCGDLPHYAWPGGYQLVYYSADFQTTFCPQCANDVDWDDDWEPRPSRVDAFYEGSPQFCDHCHAEIPSAYGDPDADEDADE